MERIKITKRLVIYTICGLLLILALLLATRNDAYGQEISPASPVLKNGFIQIIPESDQVRLEFGPQGGYEHAPWISSGILKLRVQSYLPEWSATIVPTNLEGPEGALPPDRLWIKTEETGGAFTPLTKPIPVVIGNLGMPVKDTEIAIEVRPTWQDPPGEYHGTLVLTPSGPKIKTHTSKFSARKTSSNRKGEGLDPSPSQHFTPTPGAGTPFQGLPGQVHVALTIPEIMEIAFLCGGELDFQGDGPEGTYQAQQEVRFKVITNSRKWRVLANTSNLTSERGEIPADRIHWTQVSPSGDVLDSGNLGSSNEVARSGSRHCRPNEEIILRFNIDITMADVAGSYRGNISLQGITGN